MRSRSFCRITLPLVACFVLTALSGCGAPEEPQPNVVLITLDTLRADHLGCYGYDRARTPNLDAFAESALRYDNAFSTINTTLASHASMMTGRYPQNLGVPRNSFPLGADIPTLAQLFKANGYRTAAFVSCSALSSSMGLARGFELYDETLGIVEVDQEQRRGETTTAAVLTWLEENREGPFFLWVHYFDPHFPYDPPPPYDTIHGSGYQGPADGSMVYLQRVWSGQVRPTRADHQRLLDLYDGEIAYLDHCLGPLLERFNRPEMSRTLVAITADHGEHLTERKIQYHHGSYVYQPSIRVPLIIRHPGVAEQAGTVGDTVQSLDLFPTLLGAVSITPAAGSGGQDLALPANKPRTAFAEASRPWEVEKRNPGQYQNIPKTTMVLQYPWKLVVTPYRRQMELYNLEQDPAEGHNLAAQETERARSLQQLLAGWRNQAGPAARPPDPENLRRLEALGYVQ